MLGCAGRIDCQTAQPRVPGGVAKAAAKGDKLAIIGVQVVGFIWHQDCWVRSTDFRLECYLRYEVSTPSVLAAHTSICWDEAEHSLEPINKMTRWKEPYHHPHPP
jgi:hypothetical protein